MNKLKLPMLALAAFLLVSPLAQAESDDEKAVKQVIAAFATAVNASDVDKTVATFAPNGVIMPAHFKSYIGEKAVKDFYTMAFSRVTLALKFDVKQVGVSGDMAYARVLANGSRKRKDGGQARKLNRQELFVLTRHEGQWKIAQYIFNNSVSQ